LNLGNRPILRKDWDEKLRVLFDSTTKIVDVRLAASLPNELNPKFFLESGDGENEIQFEPFLLNANEGFRTEIVIIGEQQPKLTARIVGISKIEHFGVEGRNFARALFMALTMITIAGLLAVLDGAEIFSMRNDSGEFVLSGILFIVGFAYTYFGRRFPTPLHLDEDFVDHSN
jgi:hypothetical protein